MRISTRVGRGTYVSMGCLGWSLLIFVILGLIGWAFNAATGHAATQPHHAVTESYGWPQAGVTQRGPDCLAAAAVTLLETYGLHVSQFRFAAQDPGASVGHAGVLINGYLRPLHIRVVLIPAMDAAELRLLLEASGHPILVTIHTLSLPWWHGQEFANQAHEVMIWKLTVTGARIWDPDQGWHTASVGAIAAGAWEYLIPVSSP